MGSRTSVFGFFSPNIGDTLSDHWGDLLNNNFPGVEAAILLQRGSIIFVPDGFSPTVLVNNFSSSGDVIRIVPLGSNTGTITIIMQAEIKAPYVLFNETTQQCLIQADNGFLDWLLESDTRAVFVQDSSEVYQLTPSPSITINGGTSLSNPTAIDINGQGITIEDLGGGQLTLKLQAAAGQNLFSIPPLFSTNGVTSLRNKTLWIYMPSGASIASLNPQTLDAAFGALVKSGQLNIGHAFFYQTADFLDMHVITKKAITWGGNPGVIIDATGGQATVACDNFQALSLGNSFDSYIGIYFANDPVNDTVQIGVAASGAIVCPNLIVAGDGTSVGIGGLINGGTPINDFTKHNLLVWFEITG